MTTNLRFNHSWNHSLPFQEWEPLDAPFFQFEFLRIGASFWKVVLCLWLPLGGYFFESLFCFCSFTVWFHVIFAGKWPNQNLLWIRHRFAPRVLAVPPATCRSNPVGSPKLFDSNRFTIPIDEKFDGSSYVTRFLDEKFELLTCHIDKSAIHKHSAWPPRP